MKKLLLIYVALVAFHNSSEAQYSKHTFFRSGFEGNTAIINQGALSTDIVGVDNASLPPNDWANDLESTPFSCEFSIQYQGGDSTIRLAELTKDPVDPNNNVLHFWIKSPNVNNTKGRVQANLYNCNKGFSTLGLHYHIKCYLPNDLDTLRHLPTTFKFFTLMEIWNNPPWVDSNTGFRITLNLQKKSATSNKLHLGLHGQDYNPATQKFNSVWDTTNTKFDVPTGKWIDFEVHINENVTGRNGSVLVNIKPSGSIWSNLYTLPFQTQHSSGVQSDGFKYFNPMKLYTDSGMVNTLNRLGKMAHVYWDDFEIFHYKTQNTSVNEVNQKENNISVFPNPVYKTVNVKSNSQKSAIRRIQLINVNGRAIINYPTLNTFTYKIDVSNIPDGLYLLRIDREGMQTFKQIIKIKNG